MGWARVPSATVANDAGVSTVASWAVGALGAAVSVGHKIVGITEVYNADDTTTVSSVTDSLGNTYSKDASVRQVGSPSAEIATWSAPVTTAGTPTITLHYSVTLGSGQFTGGAFVAYSGLSTSGGAAGIDITTGLVASSAGSPADSGTTVGTTSVANELKVGFYGDDGFNTTLVAGTVDTSYSAFLTHGNASNAQFLIEDHDSGASGSTARAEVTGAGTGWSMAVVVYKLAAAVDRPRGGSRPAPFAPGF